MGWDVRWVSSEASDFNTDFGTTTPEGEDFRLSVFVRDGDEVFHSYSTYQRGLDHLLNTYNLLDLTPAERLDRVARFMSALIELRALNETRGSG